MKLNPLFSTPLLCATMAAGCGFSESINGSVREQERQIEVEASKQLLLQTDLIVSSVMARANLVEPQATAQCTTLPTSQCTICYTSTPTEQAINLTTPACSIDPPEQSKQFSLRLSLRDLSLAASTTGQYTVALRGQGQLDLGAQLPILGEYKGVAAYVVRSGQVNTMTGAFSVDLRMTYKSGESDPIELLILATGSPERIQGSISGPRLSCDITGSLKLPRVACK